MKYAVEKQFFDRYIRLSAYEKLEKKCDFSDSSTRIGNGQQEDKILSIDGSVATITIRGVLLEERDPIYDWLGIAQTTYTDITTATDDADNNPAVLVIKYDAQGPGGSVSGVEEVYHKIKSSRKTTIFSVKNECCSALYWLACSADKIVATGESTQIGSIGIVVDTTDFSGWEEQVGIKDISITNRASTDKRINLATEHGISTLEDELDEIYQVFENAVIDGRSENKNFSVENVRSINGRVVASKKAVELGLIDAIIDFNDDILTINTEEPTMATLEEFLTENPEEQQKYDDALEQARQDGGKDTEEDTTDAVNADRKRIATLIELNPSAVSLQLATAIESGSDAGAFAIAMVKGGATASTPPATPTATNTNIIPAIPSARTPQESAEASAEDAALKAFDERMNAQIKKARR